MDTFMHLRQLVALADTGNFRKAGDSLGISHSAVSQTIKRLEENYGLALFERIKGKTVPTAFGERLVLSARAAVNEMDAAQRDLTLMKNFSGGRLVIGADPSVSESLLSIPMIKMMNRYPSLQFTVRHCSRSRFEKRLSQNEIDLYFGLQPDREVDELNYRKLTLQPPGLFCRQGHEALAKGRLQISDLRDNTVIGGDVPDWFLSRILDAYPDEFDGLRDLRATFLTSQDFGLLRQILLQTNAIAVLPEFIVGHELKAGLIRPIRIERWPFASGTISGVAAWLRERPLPPSALRLLTEVEQVLQQSARLSRVGDGE